MNARRKRIRQDALISLQREIARELRAASAGKKLVGIAKKRAQMEATSESIANPESGNPSESTSQASPDTSTNASMQAAGLSDKAPFVEMSSNTDETLTNILF